MEDTAINYSNNSNGINWVSYEIKRITCPSGYGYCGKNTESPLTLDIQVRSISLIDRSVS